jgi:hypothetical protein
MPEQHTKLFEVAVCKQAHGVEVDAVLGERAGIAL